MPVLSYLMITATGAKARTDGDVEQMRSLLAELAAALAAEQQAQRKLIHKIHEMAAEGERQQRVLNG